MDLPISHYEYIVTANNQTADICQQVKQTAWKSMNELEGWCTKYKASVLMDLVFMLNPKLVVEIGVFGGKSLVPMAYALKSMGNGAIYGIDPWNSHNSVEGMDDINKKYWNNVDHESIMQGLIHKINKFGLQNQIILWRVTSEEAPSLTNIDLLHIDGNHSEGTSLTDVHKWVPFVKKGGVIIFDDIGWATTDKAVQWLDNHCIRLTDFDEKGANQWGVWIKP